MVKERRRAARVDVKLDLELRLPGMQSATLGETINISSNGIYFTSEYFMDEGTKLPLRVEIPAKGGFPTAAVCPTGIVVRCEPGVEDPDVALYKVACFFMEMDEDDQLALENYIKSHLI
jgi:hypothetical protein